MNAKAEFFGNGRNGAGNQTGEDIATCPICDGWGIFKKQDDCPYCDEGVIKSTSHGWVILAAELAGDLPMDEASE